MAQSLKCLPCKHVDPSSGSQRQHKKLGALSASCWKSNGVMGGGGKQTPGVHLQLVFLLGEAPDQ